MELKRKKSLNNRNFIKLENFVKLETRKLCKTWKFWNLKKCRKCLEAWNSFQISESSQEEEQQQVFVKGSTMTGFTSQIKLEQMQPEYLKNVEH